MKKMMLLTASAMVAFGVASGAGATTVGPDTYGYVATDQVNYTFNDIRATGTKVLTGQDDNGLFVDMGMNFSMYGTSYTNAYITTNGTIFFGAANANYTNQNLTTTQVFGTPGIFTFWDDLYTRGDGDAGVYYQTIGTTPGSRKFVVQEIANSYSVGGAVVNFQTVLDEATGDILMRYTQTAFGNSNFDNGASATVGIQGVQSLGQYVQWSYNSPVLQNNESLCFTLNANAACNAIVDQPPTSGVPEPATWAMMIGGFGLIGGAMRRRGTKVAFAA